jgi:hypothetical protein
VFSTVTTCQTNPWKSTARNFDRNGIKLSGLVEHNVKCAAASLNRERRLKEKPETPRHGAIPGLGLNNNKVVKTQTDGQDGREFCESSGNTLGI